MKVRDERWMVLVEVAALWTRSVSAVGERGFFIIAVRAGDGACRVVDVVVVVHCYHGPLLLLFV